MPITGTPIRLRPEVAEALAWGRPVVALESTLFAHGLPRPDNLALARELEAIVREEGGVPATVGVIRGEPIVGLTDAEIEQIATSAEVPKLSVRDLAPAAARCSDGATTVASTALLATVVAPSLHRAAAGARSRTLSFGTSALVAICSISASVKPTIGSPRITPTVAGTPPSSRTIASSSRASDRLSGRGSPCAKSVLSSATTGRPQASASATSGRSRIGVPVIGIQKGFSSVTRLNL